MLIENQLTFNYLRGFIEKPSALNEPLLVMIIAISNARAHPSIYNLIRMLWNFEGADGCKIKDIA